MALSAAAVTAAAQVAFLLAGKVLSAVRAVSKAHLVKQRELQLMQQLQDKLHDRVVVLKSFEDSLPTDSLLGNFAVLQNNRQVVHRTLDYISTGLQAILDREESLATADSCIALQCFCRAAGNAAFQWDGLADQVTLWNSQLDKLPQQLEGNDAFLKALHKTRTRPQKCTIPALAGLYIPIEALIREAAEMLTDVDGAKLVIIAGSPGMGKSMLANHLACTSLLNSRPLKSSEAFGNGHESLAASFPDGVLWLDFRNKLDLEGLLLLERLHDLLKDINPHSSDLQLTASDMTYKAVEDQICHLLASRSFLIVVDNVHAHDRGTVESICRAASRNSGKVLVTSCQSNFGPSCGAARVVSILPGVVKRSGIAVRLLLAEAGLIFLRGPEQDLGGVNPAIRDCAKNIVSSTAGVGYCLGAVALIGSKRRQNPTDIQGWLSTQWNVAALTQGQSQVAGNFLQEILELSVRDSLEGLSKAALEVLVVVTLFPTGAPILTCVVETVWRCCSNGPNSSIWDLLDELVAATLLQMPRPGAVLVQSLHSGFVHQWQGTSDFCSPAKMLRRLLAGNPSARVATALLVIYGGNIARRAAAACYGFSERSDQVWAYNKATAGTGGLAVLLLVNEDLGRAAARLLCQLPLPWLTQEFWAALQEICQEMKKVMQSQEGLPANATPQKWTSNNALAAILDSLAAILRISNADEYSRELLPEVSGCCKKLLNIAHPDVKLKAAVLLDLLRVGKGGSSGQAAKQACPSNYPGSATEEIQAPFAAVNSPGDLNQSAGAESFENSFQKARRLGEARDAKSRLMIESKTRQSKPKEHGR